MDKLKVSVLFWEERTREEPNTMKPSMRWLKLYPKAATKPL